MTTKRMMLAAAAAILAGTTTMAGVAYADPGCAEGRIGMGWARMHMWQNMADRYDTNKDGKVTQDEITGNRQSWYVEFDTDKDGKLSLAEFEKLWLKARHRMMVREFQFLDTDGDGIVSLTEYQAPLADIVSERDRNGDGALSREDRPRGGPMGRMRWHKNNDQDDNGNDQNADPDSN
jgi:EF hand domain-containing protein